MRYQDLNEFELKIIGPYETSFKGKIVSLVAKTPKGKVGVLANHTTYLGILSTGKIKYTLKTGEDHFFDLDGGLLKVKDNKAAVIYF